MLSLRGAFRRSVAPGNETVAPAAQTVDADLVVLDPVAGRSAFVGDDVGVDVGAARAARPQPCARPHPGVQAEVAPGALAPLDRDAPERVAPGPHRRIGDARATGGERRHAVLTAAGQVELVDGAALVEEAAGAARVHRDDRPWRGPGAEVDAHDVRERLDRGVRHRAVDAQHQPLHLAPAGACPGAATPARRRRRPARTAFGSPTLTCADGGRHPGDEQRRDDQPHAPSGSPAPRHRRRRYQRRLQRVRRARRPAPWRSTRLRPPRLAAYSAASASATRLPSSMRSPRAVATPNEHVTCSPAVSQLLDRDAQSSRRSAPRRSSAAPGSSSANSSPPRR